MLPKTIHRFRTYNPLEASSTGYDIDFLDNGQAVLSYETRWGRCVHGNVFRVDSLPQDVSEALDREIQEQDHGYEPDLEAALEPWLNSSNDAEMAHFNPAAIDLELPAGWKLIQKGTYIS